MARTPPTTDDETTVTWCVFCRDFNGKLPPNFYMNYTANHYYHAFHYLKAPVTTLCVTDPNYYFSTGNSHPGLYQVRFNDQCLILCQSDPPVRFITAWLNANAKVEPKVDHGENDYYRDSHNMLKDIIDKLQDDVAACQRQVQERDRLVESLQQEKAALYSQIQTLMQLLVPKAPPE